MDNRTSMYYRYRGGGKKTIDHVRILLILSSLVCTSPPHERRRLDEFVEDGLCAGIILVAIVAGLAIPVVSSAEDYATFTSEEYGFVMKYPTTWVKVEPKGSYYLVFQAPNLVDKFRPRIHVAAHQTRKRSN